MFGWVTSKIQKYSADTMRDELTRFIASLSGQSDHELATLLIIATGVRLNVIKEGPLSEKHFDMMRYNYLEANENVSLSFNKLVRLFQKNGQTSDAAGAMVWLHSSRAMLCPEIRILGRDMWGQLMRGAPNVPMAFMDLSLLIPDLSGEIVEEANFIPMGLEP